jgi:hypothetical protein
VKLAITKVNGFPFLYLPKESSTHVESITFIFLTCSPLLYPFDSHRTSHRKKGQFPYWFIINQNTLCCDMSGCLILTFMEPISSYSGGNRHYLRGPSGVASSGLSLRFLIIWHHQGEPFLRCASFSEPFAKLKLRCACPRSRASMFCLRIKTGCSWRLGQILAWRLKWTPQSRAKKSNSGSLLAKAETPASPGSESPLETEALTPFDRIRSSVNLSQFVDYYTLASLKSIPSRRYL